MCACFVLFFYSFVFLFCVSKTIACFLLVIKCFYSAAYIMGLHVLLVVNKGFPTVVTSFTISCVKGFSHVQLFTTHNCVHVLCGGVESLLVEGHVVAPQAPESCDRVHMCTQEPTGQSAIANSKHSTLNTSALNRIYTNKTSRPVIQCTYNKTSRPVIQCTSQNFMQE